MIPKSQNFTLILKGSVLPDPYKAGAIPMTRHRLRDNLESMIGLAISEGSITCRTTAELEDWNLSIEITEGVAWADDIGLSADQLDDKYNPVGEGEHPYFRREDWRTAVAQEEIISGYWVWVVSQIDSYNGGDEEIDPDTKNWVPED